MRKCTLLGLVALLVLVMLMPAYGQSTDGTVDFGVLSGSTWTSADEPISGPGYYAQCTFTHTTTTFAYTSVTWDLWVEDNEQNLLWYVDDVPNTTIKLDPTKPVPAQKTDRLYLSLDFVYDDTAEDNILIDGLPKGKLYAKCKISYTFGIPPSSGLVDYQGYVYETHIYTTGLMSATGSEGCILLIDEPADEVWVTAELMDGNESTSSVSGGASLFTLRYLCPLPGYPSSGATSPLQDSSVFSDIADSGTTVGTVFEDVYPGVYELDVFACDPNPVQSAGAFWYSLYLINESLEFDHFRWSGDRTGYVSLESYVTDDDGGSITAGYGVETDPLGCEMSFGLSSLPTIGTPTVIEMSDSYEYSYGGGFYPRVMYVDSHEDDYLVPIGNRPTRHQVASYRIPCGNAVSVGGASLDGGTATLEAVEDNLSEVRPLGVDEEDDDSSFYCNSYDDPVSWSGNVTSNTDMNTLFLNNEQLTFEAEYTMVGDPALGAFVTGTSTQWVPSVDGANKCRFVGLMGDNGITYMGNWFDGGSNEPSICVGWASYALDPAWIGNNDTEAWLWMYFYDYATKQGLSVEDAVDETVTDFETAFAAVLASNGKTGYVASHYTTQGTDIGLCVPIQ